MKYNPETLVLAPLGEITTTDGVPQLVGVELMDNKELEDRILEGRVKDE